MGNVLQMGQQDPIASQMQQVGMTTDEYMQAQADMQRAKQRQMLAQQMGQQKSQGDQWGNVAADVLSKFLSVKEMKGAGESWAEASKKIGAYEKQEREAERARTEAQRKTELERQDAQWQKRFDVKETSSQKALNEQRDYQRGVAKSSRTQQLEDMEAKHKRTVELAKMRATKRPGGLSEAGKIKMRADMTLRNKASESAVTARQSLDRIKQLKERLVSGKVDSGFIETAVNPLEWKMFNADQEAFDIDAKNLAESTLKAKFGAQVTDSEREAAYRNNVNVNNDESTNIAILDQQEKEMQAIIDREQTINQQVMQTYSGGQPQPQPQPQRQQQQRPGQDQQYPTQVIDGVTYVNINGQWYQQ